MKKIVIYPFSSKSLPLLLYLEKFNSDYSIGSIVSPPGLGMCGKDAGAATNRSSLGFEVEENLVQAIEKNDALFIPSGDIDEPMYYDIWNIIINAVKMKKDIICNLKMPQKKRAYLKRICKEQHVQYTDCLIENRSWMVSTLFQNNTISVPVIFVGEMVAEADDFEVTLSITNQLKQERYKVTVVGEYPEYNFLGLHGSSLFMESFNKKGKIQDISKTIIMLNHYFHYLEMYEQPDIFIVQIPGGIINTNNFFAGECGVYLYILLQAIRPDYFIGCSLYNKITQEDIQVISNEFNSRYGMAINCLHVSNKALDVQQTMQLKKGQYIYMPEESMNDIISYSNVNIPIYNIFDKKQQEIMTKQIIQDLSES